MTLTSRSWAGTEYHIQSGGSGPTVFQSLEQLREAVSASPPRIHLANGDVIVLHNDDFSLTEDLRLRDLVDITIRSEGEMRTITTRPGSNPPNILDGGRITIDNVRFADSVSNGNLNGAPVFGYDTSGVNINISNSIFENNYWGSGGSGGLSIVGGGEINITNTIFRNNGGTNALLIDNTLGETTNVNVVVDNSSDRHIVWEQKNPNSNGSAIRMIANGDTNLNFDIASGKKLTIQGSITTGGISGWSTLTKNGDGTLKIGKSNEIGSIDIAKGTLEFSADVTGSNRNEIFDLTIRNGGIFKPVVYEGTRIPDFEKDQELYSASASRFTLVNFYAEEGAKMEIGGISHWPSHGNVPDPHVSHDGRLMGGSYVNLIKFYEDPVSGDIIGSGVLSDSLAINNRLMEAHLFLGDTENNSNEDPDPDSINGIILKISRVNNLSILEGVGSYADSYRKLDTLSEVERDALDRLYARGGMDPESLGHLQTIGGANIMQAQLAMRHNFANVIRQISRRTTAFQKEELELEVTSGGYCYTDENPTVSYGGIFAAIDQRWYDQDDIHDTAGYKYNPYGINIGYEKHLDQWIFGGLVRYDDGDIKLKSNTATRTEVQTVLAALYGSWASEGYYVTGGLHMGRGWNDSRSVYTMPGMAGLVGRSGTYNTSLYGINIEGGYMMEFDNFSYPFRATPYAGIAYAKVGREGFAEKGADFLNRNFHKSDWDLWDMDLGVRLAMPMDWEDKVIIPTFEASWVRTMGTPGGNVTDVTLKNNPKGTWQVDPLGRTRSALHLGAGVTAKLNKNLDIGLNYDFEWRRKSISNQLQFNMSLGF